MGATRESPLAEAEQLLADLQRQLAECRAERDEALAGRAAVAAERDEVLAQQTATSEVLQVINSSPGDLKPVFDAILEKAHTLCGVAYGSLQVYDGERFQAVAVRGLPEELADQLRQGYRGSDTPASRPLVEGESVAQIADLAAIDHPMARRAVELAGMRTLLSVALRKDKRLIGMIIAGRKEVRPFQEKEIALLQNFAAQAVIAMEHARLITETREALEQQAATAEVLGVINSSPGDLAPVFDALLEKAMRLCEAAIGELCTYDGERFTTAAIRGETPAYIEARAMNPAAARPGTGSRRVIETKRPLHILDMQIEAQNRPAESRALIELSGIRTSLTVPLLRDETFLGFIRVYRREVKPFTDQQIALLESFAAQAVIAMENARLITETREALEQQTATAEVLQVINSSPGDLAPVFDAMLEKATRLCEAAAGIFWIYDGARFRAIAQRGLPNKLLAELQTNPIPTASLQKIVDGANVVRDDDLSKNRGAERVVGEGGMRTGFLVALRKGETLLGAIRIHRREARPFSDKEIALVQNFAAQAVIAMENARLLGELRQRTDEVGELNRGLEARVAEQVDELGRVGRLKRFLAPQLAELIVSQGDERILESHRREIVVVFCDLRGYTAFTETAEPEEVLDFLREYHGALGPLVSQFEGTLDQFSGDGIMVFFNDPIPCPDPAERAVKMAMAMREAAGALIVEWRERGRDLGFGAGIAQGYATLGQIGFSERSGYTAIGTVCNIAARLCAEAKDGQILLGQRVNVALKGSVATEQLGPLALKGLTQPVVAYNVPHAATQPALRVIEGGPQSV